MVKPLILAAADENMSLQQRSIYIDVNDRTSRQVDADLSSIEAELAALALQKQEAVEAATAAAAAAEAAAAEPSPQLPSSPRPASPPASVHSSDVEDAAESLAMGLSQLAAQDGDGFPSPAVAIYAAGGDGAADDATPMRKRLLQRHRTDSSSLHLAGVGDGEIAGKGAGTDEAEDMVSDGAAPPEQPQTTSGAAAAARIAETAAAAEAQVEAVAEAAAVEEILAAPEMTEVTWYGRNVCIAESQL